MKKGLKNILGGKSAKQMVRSSEKLAKRVEKGSAKWAKKIGKV